MLLNNKDLEKALGMVGELLYADGETVSIVIIGGAALNLLGVVNRTTRDVDVVAMTSSPGEKLVAPTNPLPAPLLKAVETVARDLDLAPNWLNRGPASQWEIGLPPGFADRLHWRSYGPLHVGIADQLDLVHFKLEAAADQPSAESNRHLEDLLALRPSDSDLETAVAWVKEKNVGPGYHEIVNKVRDYVIAHR